MRAFARKALLAILLFAVIGTGAELVLLGHYEDWKQWLPLALLGGLLVLLACAVLTRSARVLRTLRWVALASIVSGVAGLILHFRENAAFEREMYPSMDGLELVWEALRGATPALAPGTMIQLGLLVWLYLYRHPSLTTESRDSTVQGD